VRGGWALGLGDDDTRALITETYVYRFTAPAGD